MGFFSQSNPDLISRATIKKLLLSDNLLVQGGQKNTENNFYTNYIEPNLLILILFIIFCLFLLYRYYTKENKESFVPTFNPSIPVDEQQSYVHYMDNEIPLNFNGKFETRNERYPPNPIIEEYPPLITPPQDRDLYVGTTDTYYDAKDTKIPHPYGWPSTFNTTTGQAVKFMTDQNTKNLDDLGKRIFDQNESLISPSAYSVGCNFDSAYFPIDFDNQDFLNDNKQLPYVIDKPYV